MKLLLHTCCGPCLLIPYDRLKADHRVAVYYYNPNIDPVSEYRKRLDVASNYCRSEGVEFIEASYDQSEYEEASASDKTKPNRCRACFRLRLGKTAAFAEENGFIAFSTTLLVSPYQLHDDLRSVGEEVADESGIDFLYRDFRPLYDESVKLSRALAMYRQNYCGCSFGKDEREAEKDVKKHKAAG